MKEVKDKKNKLKRHACIFTLNSLLFILSLGLSVVQMVSYLKPHRALELQRHSADISSQNCGETYKTNVTWNVPYVHLLRGKNWTTF